MFKELIFLIFFFITIYYKLKLRLYNIYNKHDKRIEFGTIVKI
jgi:hypothetical protein